MATTYGNNTEVQKVHELIVDTKCMVVGNSTARAHHIICAMARTLLSFVANKEQTLIAESGGWHRVTIEIGNHNDCRAHEDHCRGGKIASAPTHSRYLSKRATTLMSTSACFQRWCDVLEPMGGDVLPSENNIQSQKKY